eukprot:CFRG5023T1
MSAVRSFISRQRGSSLDVNITSNVNNDVTDSVNSAPMPIKKEDRRGSDRSLKEFSRSIGRRLSVESMFGKPDKNPSTSNLTNNCAGPPNSTSGQQQTRVARNASVKSVDGQVSKRGHSAMKKDHKRRSMLITEEQTDVLSNGFPPVLHPNKEIDECEAPSREPSYPAGEDSYTDMPTVIETSIRKARKQDTRSSFVSKWKGSSIGKSSASRRMPNLAPSQTISAAPSTQQMMESARLELIERLKITTKSYKDVLAELASAEKHVKDLTVEKEKTLSSLATQKEVDERNGQEILRLYEEIAALSNRLDVEKRNGHAIEAKLEERRVQCELLEGQNQGMHTELQIQNKRLTEDLEKQKRIVKVLQHSLCDCTSAASEEHTSRLHLEESLKASETAMENMKSSLSKATCDVNAVESEVDSLRKEITRMSSEIVNHIRNDQELRTIAKERDDEIQDLRYRINVAQKESREKMSACLVEMEGQHQDTVNELSKTIDDLQTQLEDALTTCTSLSNANLELSDKYRGTEKKLKEFEVSNLAMRDELKQKEEAITHELRLRKELEVSQAEKHVLREELAAIHTNALNVRSSTSTLTPTRSNLMLAGDERIGRHKITNKHVRFPQGVEWLDCALVGDLDGINRFFDEGFDVNYGNDEGLTALHNACCEGQYHVVKTLLERGADPNCVDQDLWRPLHSAACFGHLDLAKLLIVYGADVEAVNTEGDTPANVADDDECLRYLKHEVQLKHHEHTSQFVSIYDYEAKSGDELSFKENEALYRLDRESRDWWQVRNTHEEVGMVPSAYLRVSTLHHGPIDE